MLRDENADCIGCDCPLCSYQVDIAVVEAGLGGERDATNVFTADELKVAIFTAVGMEHAAALGVSMAPCRDSSIAANQNAVLTINRHKPTDGGSARMVVWSTSPPALSMQLIHALACNSC